LIFTLISELALSENKMTTEYRIDKAYEKIYKETDNCYLFLCSFYQIGAKASMRDKTILKLVDEWETRQLMCEFENDDLD
jgi:hypothetical protein